MYPKQLLAGLMALCCLALAGTVQGEDEAWQTDWLELVKGYRGNTVGAELMEVEDTAEDGSRRITLAIPKSSMADPDAIEEVLVVGKRPGKPKPLDITYEWLRDYDNDNYGLVIRLGKDSKWPIRLYLNSSPGFTGDASALPGN